MKSLCSSFRFVAAEVTRLIFGNSKRETRDREQARASLRRLLQGRWGVAAALAMTALALDAVAADKKIVLVAGRPSLGPGDHEHRAGCLLLKQCLDHVPGI